MRKNTDGINKSHDYTSAELLDKAIKCAALAHKKHNRKGTKTPYIVHQFEAAQILSSEECNTNVVIAVLLHDTVEDTRLPFACLQPIIQQLVILSLVKRLFVLQLYEKIELSLLYSYSLQYVPLYPPVSLHFILINYERIFL